MSSPRLYFANPGEQLRVRRAQIDAAIASVLDGGRYIQGPAHDGFEREFADYLGVAHALGVGSGTDAIVLALWAAGIGAADEVIVPSHTAPPTISAIRQIGAVPHFIDVNPHTYVIDEENVAAAIGPATRAIIGVHLYGYPFDAPSLRKLADERGIFLIEDCAQAAGASIGRRRVGSIGHFGCFSFFPTKNLGCIGDGGAVVTNDCAAAEHLRRLRLYGWSPQRVCLEDGLNSRLDEIQAAILCLKLKDLDADNARRSNLAQLYNRKLAGLEIDLPPMAEKDGTKPVFHLYVIASDRRDELMAHLLEDQIVCGIHYAKPNHQHPAYEDFGRAALVHTERLVGRIISLPMYPELLEHDVERVCRSIHSFFA